MIEAGRVMAVSESQSMTAACILRQWREVGNETCADAGAGRVKPRGSPAYNTNYAQPILSGQRHPLEALVPLGAVNAHVTEGMPGGAPGRAKDGNALRRRNLFSSWR